MKLDKKAVEAAIMAAPTEGDAVVAVYKLIYPQWADIEKVGDDTQSWPACNADTWKAICRVFQDLTARLNIPRRCDKQVMPGGVWMNNGFTQDDSLKDWHVKAAPVTLKQPQAEVANA